MFKSINANQNQDERFTPLRIRVTTTFKTCKQMLGGVEILEHLGIVCGNVNMMLPLWKTVWQLPEKLKIELLYDLAILSWVYI